MRLEPTGCFANTDERRVCGISITLQHVLQHVDLTCYSFFFSSVLIPEWLCPYPPGFLFGVSCLLAVQFSIRCNQCISRGIQWPAFRNPYMAIFSYFFKPLFRFLEPFFRRNNPCLALIPVIGKVIQPAKAVPAPSFVFGVFQPFYGLFVIVHIRPFKYLVSERPYSLCPSGASFSGADPCDESVQCPGYNAHSTSTTAGISWE